ncbi:Structural maintenance of chromosomes protein 5, partial [Pseudolycoriella hygida]
LNVKEGYSKYFENLIPLRDLLAFTCEDKDDVQVLFHHLRNVRKFDVNIYSVKPVRSLEFASPPLSAIAKLGFTHFLLDLVEGPLTLINHLCRSKNIHAIPLGSERTRAVSDKVPKNFQLFFTPNHRFHVMTSRYSDESCCEMNEIAGKNLLNISIDNAALENLKIQRAELIRSSDKCRNEQIGIENQIKELEVKINDLDTRKSQIESKFYNVETCKTNLQRQIKLVENLKARFP